MLSPLKIATTASFLLLVASASAQTMSGAPPARSDPPASGTSASGTSASSESLGEHIDDSTITAKAKAELIGAKDVKASHVHVKTRRGVVSLTGTVPGAADKQRAQEIVEGISGVRSVRNRLKVTQAGADE
jgi:hyperosmotically inducible periplasmic protein